MVTIYGLRGVVGGIRYVGLTRRLRHCLAQYRNRGHTRHLDNWLKQQGAALVVVVLEEVDERAADVRERHWIAQLRATGHDLLNYTVGGEGGYRMSEQVKARLRAVQKRIVAEQGPPIARMSAEVNARRVAALRGIPHPWSVGRFTELNRSRRGIPLSEVHRQKVSEALRGRRFSAAHRANMHAAALVREARKREGGRPTVAES